MGLWFMTTWSNVPTLFHFLKTDDFFYGKFVSCKMYSTVSLGRCIRDTIFTACKKIPLALFVQFVNKKFVFVVFLSKVLLFNPNRMAATD